MMFLPTLVPSPILKAPRDTAIDYHEQAYYGKSQQADGLWLARVEALPADEAVAPAPQFEPCVRALASAMRSIEQDATAPFLEPYRFDDAGWVANRWCEILPISVAAKHKLMALPDGQLRLELVDEYLRSHQLVK